MPSWTKNKRCWNWTSQKWHKFDLFTLFFVFVFSLWRFHFFRFGHSIRVGYQFSFDSSSRHTPIKNVYNTPPPPFFFSITHQIRSFFPWESNFTVFVMQHFYILLGLFSWFLEIFNTALNGKICGKLLFTMDYGLQKNCQQSCCWNYHFYW